MNDKGDGSYKRDVKRGIYWGQELSQESSVHRRSLSGRNGFLSVV